MRVCLMIEGQEDVTWEQWRALAAACEEHGFDALFRSDHYLSFGRERDWGTLDAWGTVCALAATTDRIHLGTLVSPVTFRHPSVLAKTAVTADHVSGGRIEVGMGAGWFVREHLAYGFPFSETRQRLDVLAEQVEIVHRLWDRDEDRVSFEGTHFRLEEVTALPKPLQDPHPRLVLGGRGGRRSVELAVRWADEYNTYGQTPDECRAIRDRLSRACEAIGRDPDSIVLSVMTRTLVGADEPELEDRAAGLAERQGGGDARTLLAQAGPGELVGTTEQVLERLAVLAEVGVRRVMLQHLVHDDLESLALIGRTVIPEATSL